MKDFYDFASNSPILTFFLFMIIGECIYKSFQAIFGKKDEDEECN